jgi:hypothetical protein
MDEETPAYVCDMSLCPPNGVKADSVRKPASHSCLRTGGVRVGRKAWHGAL